MYADLLSSALDNWVELSGKALLDYARVCRDTVEHPGVYGAVRSSDLLVAEVAYDRALVRLCELQGIEVEASWFVHPAEARRRLEGDLAASGLDLTLGSPDDPDDSDDPDNPND
jgi:hypothetical protein